MTRALRAASVAACLLCSGPSGPAAAGSGDAEAPAAPISAETLETIQQGLATIRGQAYRAPVVLETLRKEQVTAFLERKLDEDYPEAVVADEKIAYVHFGLLAPEDDLEGLFLDLLAEQAAGFYDPDEKRLFLVEGKPFPGAALIHELAHALQDQTFGVGPLLEAAKADDDRLRALQAMIEGEAMALTTAYSVRYPEQASRLDAVAGDGNDAQDAGESLESLGRFPDVLQADLLFPYTQGMEWVTSVVRSGGEARMDSLFRNPPDSTEQILHPARMGPPRDEVSTVADSLLPSLPEEGYRTVKTNTMGEYGIRQLFGGAGNATASEAAAGWDGDRYRVYEGAAKRTAMVWVSVWDTPGDAAGFAAAARDWLGARHPSGEGFRLSTGGPEGCVVSIVEGFADDLRRRIAAGVETGLATGVTRR